MRANRVQEWVVLLALQAQVDMPRLVASLTDWDAVRLGSLGPITARR